jgi:hypothetical protein
VAMAHRAMVRYNAGRDVAAVWNEDRRPLLMCSGCGQRYRWQGSAGWGPVDGRQEQSAQKANRPGILALLPREAWRGVLNACRVPGLMRTRRHRE